MYNNIVRRAVLEVGRTRVEVGRARVEVGREKWVTFSAMVLMSLLKLSAVGVWLYICVHCRSQEYPYVSFNGTNLTNHSYVDLSLVNGNTHSVSCHTDLQSMLPCVNRVVTEETGTFLMGQN